MKITELEKSFPVNCAPVLRAAFYRTPPNDCFWRCHPEFVFVIYIGYPAAITLKLKEDLDIRGYCSYY